MRSKQRRTHWYAPTYNAFYGSSVIKHNRGAVYRALPHIFSQKQLCSGKNPNRGKRVPARSA
jgi:hypothetical protein